MAIKIMKYRIYPSNAQKTALLAVLDACRWVYNKTLEVRRNAWNERRESLSLYDTHKMLTKWKLEHDWLSRAFSQSLQEAQERVDFAFQSFFRRCRAGKKPGYPRLKGEWYKSFTYKQASKGFKFTDDGRLYLSKIGNVRIKLHRPVEGKIKRLHIKRDILGNWYACFVVEFDPEPLPLTCQVVGIDVGLAYFATLSTGEQVPNPRFFRQDERVLAKARQRLSACKMGTPEYLKRKRVIQHIYQRIANRRRDFAHKLSRRLVNEFQIIAFENLDIQGMQDGNWRSMNKSISDAAWRMFMDFTAYKAANAGRLSPRVDPRGTTQMCSDCGRIVPKTLSDRIHDCPYCGLILLRDENAARNILALGMQSVRLDRLKPCPSGHGTSTDNM